MLTNKTRRVRLPGAAAAVAILATAAILVLGTAGVTGAWGKGWSLESPAIKDNYGGYKGDLWDDRRVAVVHIVDNTLATTTDAAVEEPEDDLLPTFASLGFAGTTNRMFVQIVTGLETLKAPKVGPDSEETIPLPPEPPRLINKVTITETDGDGEVRHRAGDTEGYYRHGSTFAGLAIAHDWCRQSKNAPCDVILAGDWDLDPHKREAVGAVMRLFADGYNTHGIGDLGRNLGDDSWKPDGSRYAFGQALTANGWLLYSYDSSELADSVELIIRHTDDSYGFTNLDSIIGR